MSSPSVVNSGRLHSQFSVQHLLPVLARNEDENFSNSRSEESFFVVLPELAAVDIHVELKFDILRTFDLLEKLNNRLVVSQLQQTQIEDRMKRCFIYLTLPNGKLFQTPVWSR